MDRDMPRNKTSIQFLVVIFLGVVMELTSDAGAVPLQLHKRDDIIAGQDFLSVFIAGSSRLDSQRPQATTTTSTTSMPSTGYNEDALRPISRGSRSSMYHEDIVDNMNNANAEKRNKLEVLPLEIMFTNVNSDGSEQKITMEELEAASSNSFESKLENSHTISADIQSKLRELYAEHQNSNAYSHSTLAPYIDQRQNQTEKQYRPAQVISISVSSSVGVSQVHKSLITTAVPPIETTMQSLSNYNSNENATNISSNEDFVILSNSNKSEFTIEEDPPRTKDNDYSKGSATNMHSVLAPSEQTVGANEAYIEQQRSRHQRREEPNHPYHQRVIYHTDPKDGTGPRSVSYSTVVQTINQHHDRWEQVPDHKYSPQPEKAYDPQMQYAFNNTEPETILPNPEKLQSPPDHVYSEPSKIYSEPEKVYSEPAKIYSEPAKNYGEPAKVYSEPAKVYSEPARVYGVPEKVYSEPAKIYSEPAKIYSEPSKIYSEPAKIYSEPAKVYNEHPREIENLNPHNFRHGESQKQYIPTALEAGVNQNHRQNMHRVSFGSSVKSSYDETNAPQEEIKMEDHQQTYDEHGRSNHKQSWDYPQQVYRKTEHPVTDPSTVSRPQIYDTTPEQNYEVDEAVSVMTNGRAHGIQSSSKEDDNQKKGYVVEGRNFRKYRVEERTSDGFIVGEYGVVSHDDGSLRGVRYTADGTINPRLIYDALMKFLSL